MSSFLYAQIAQQRKTAAATAATSAATDAAIRSFHMTAEDSDEKPSSTKKSGVGGYVEAMAALVPTEVLTLHALILSATTQIIPTKSIGEQAKTAIAGKMDAAGTAPNTITVISDAGSLEIAFWVLALISMALYLVPRLYEAWAAAKKKGANWRTEMGAADWARAAVPPLAFTAWTMLQRATAFDAAFPHLTESQRTVFGLLLAAIVIAGASWLAYKPAPPPQS
jgi:hypothetical protein